MAAILSGVGPGDEVIMPSYTFVSTANAFVLRGATPVFGDIRPEQCSHNAHMYYILVAGLNERTELIDWLKANRVEPVFHYVPLHDSPAGKRFARTAGPLPRTGELSERLLRLPCYYNLTEDDVRRIVALIRQFFTARA